jgi:hypothetical protein
MASRSSFEKKIAKMPSAPFPASSSRATSFLFRAPSRTNINRERPVMAATKTTIAVIASAIGTPRSVSRNA